MTAQISVPETVQIISKLMFEVNPIAARLLTHPSMQYVWREIRNETKNDRIPVTRESLGRLDSWRRLKTWEISEYDFSPNDLAAAALFAFAVVEMGIERTAITNSARTAEIALWIQAARQCRQALAGHMPNPRLSEEQRNALSLVANYFDDQRKLFESVTKDSSYRIERSSKDDDRDVLRGRVKAIATEMVELFGSPLYSTVATIVTVGLKLDPQITHKHVENWLGLSQ